LPVDLLYCFELAKTQVVSRIVGPYSRSPIHHIVVLFS
jgi:hypothetical protein